MIDEDERRVLESQGLIEADLIGHGILFRLRKVASVPTSEAAKCAGQFPCGQFSGARSTG